MCEQGHRTPEPAWGGDAVGGGEFPINGYYSFPKTTGPQNGPSWGRKALKPHLDTCFTEQDTKAQSDQVMGRGAHSEFAKPRAPDKAREHLTRFYTYNT